MVSVVSQLVYTDVIFVDLRVSYEAYYSDMLLSAVAAYIAYVRSLAIYSSFSKTLLHLTGHARRSIFLNARLLHSSRQIHNQQTAPTSVQLITKSGT